jgi:hypothetical protein
MKVVEYTHSRLVIKHQPIVRWILGMSLFTIDLFFWIPAICFDFNYLNLTCTRSSLPEINCELKKFTSVGSMEELKIFAPQKAYIQTVSRKADEIHQVIIVSKLGKISLLPNISYEDDKVFISEFNSFINSSKSFLTLHQNNRNYYIFLSVYMLVGVGICLFLVTTPVTTCSFDKNMNKVLIERKSLRSNKVMEYPLEEIHSLYTRNKPYRNSTIYQAVISTKDSQEIPINPQYTDKQDVDDVVAKIRHFLNFQD